METPLFYDLFKEVKEHPKLTPLGVSEYLLLVKVLNSGHRVKTFDEFMFLCETLWLKNYERRNEFYAIFEKRRRLLIDFIAELEHEANRKDDVIPTPEPPEPLPKPFVDPISKNPFSGDNTHTTKQKEPVGSVPKPFTDLDRTGPESMITITQKEGDHKSQKEVSIENPGSGNLSALSSPFIFSKNYFPVANRELQQIWRSLRYNREENSVDEIDFPVTIKQLAREGIFTGLHYKKEINNTVSLFVFIDRGNSMAVFEEFGKELGNAAVQSQAHSNARTMYFSNLPEKKGSNYLLWNDSGEVSYNTAGMFNGCHKKNIALLIYSDAGANGEFADYTRVEKTKDFLIAVSGLTARIAWVNPQPRFRWINKTAGAIADSVPMFEATPAGIEGAINTLKGKTNIY